MQNLRLSPAESAEEPGRTNPSGGTVLKASWPMPISTVRISVHTVLAAHGMHCSGIHQPLGSYFRKGPPRVTSFLRATRLVGGRTRLVGTHSRKGQMCRGHCGLLDWTLPRFNLFAPHRRAARGAEQTAPRRHRLQAEQARGLAECCPIMAAQRELGLGPSLDGQFAPSRSFDQAPIGSAI